MKRTNLVRILETWDAKNRRVFTTGDLRNLLPEETDFNFANGVTRLSRGDDAILKRAARGIYVYANSKKPWTHISEEIARTLRRGYHTYVSLESALSEHGVISQIPIDTLTLVTTGRPGRFETEWGTIEFVHTRRQVLSFVENLLDVGRPLRLANPELALDDLTRKGRNLHMVQHAEMEILKKERETMEVSNEPVF